MKRILLTLLIMFTGIALAWAAPKITCDVEIHDFGKAYDTDPVKHDFIIRNTGDDELIVKRVRACCGSSADIENTKIGPGASTFLKIEALFRGVRGKAKSSFYIESNDPGCRYLELKIEGDVTSGILVEPRSLDFGLVHIDKTVERRVNVSCLSGMSLSITNLISPFRQVHVEYKRSGNNNYVVSAKAIPPLPRGFNSSSIRLFTDNPRYREIKIPLIINGESDIVVSPKELVINRTSSSDKPVTKNISLRSKTRKDFKILDVQVPDPDIKTKITSFGSAAQYCQLSNIVPFPGLDGMQVVLTTDHAVEKQIKIPIKVVEDRKPSYQRAPVQVDRKKEFTPVVIDYFYEPGCPDCIRVREQVIPQLHERFEGYYVLNEYDVGTKSNVIRLISYQDKLGIKENEPVCMVIDYKHVLNGFSVIREDLFGVLDESIALRAGSGWTAPEPISFSGDGLGAAKERIEQFAMPAIMAAGLIDGINPCAIGTLVFFMSLLSVSKIRGRKLLAMGVSYCIATFITYIAIGFGLLRVLHLFSGFEMFRTGVEIIVIFVLAVFAFLSFRDACRYKVSGDVKDVKLQLPESIKNTVRSVVHSGLGVGSLILGGFFIGVVVTALESVCTGQAYVPALVLVIKHAETLSRSVPYLFVYNLMFIVPLILVFVFTCLGVNSRTLLDWSKKNVVIAKTLLGILFVAMALLIGLN